MNSLAYDDLARELLVMLIASGELKAAEHDRLIAYETYYLPPRIRVELPDADRYTGLLNPRSTQEHTDALAQSLLHVVTTEERDSWIVTAPDIAIAVQLAASGSVQARPVYTLTDAPVDQDGKANTLSEALVRLKVGAATVVLRRGDGLLPVSRSRRSPRISVLEAPDVGHEVAFLVVGGPTTVQTADGRSRDYPAHAQIPITHDIQFRVGARRWRLWERSIDGTAEVLGVSRAQRPNMRIVTPEDGTVEWDRNREPHMVLSDAPEAHIASETLQFRLHSSAGDRIEIESINRRSNWITWFDRSPLLVPALHKLPLQGSHIKALGHETGSMPVHMTGRAPQPEPHSIEVHGWMPPSTPKQNTFGGLFGFEQPVATIFEDGRVLRPEQTPKPIQVPVHAPELVKPLFRIALDGCRGCKLMPLTVELTADDLDLHINAWTWIEGLVALELPGMRLRLEALDLVKLIYSEPQHVTHVSADPDDAWQIEGWRIRTTGDALQIEGQGRADLVVDRRSVSKPSSLAALREHRVQAGRGLYRIVRRNFEPGPREEDR